MSQATRLRIERSTDQGQTIAINVLIGCFTLLVMLLGVVLGVAIGFVVLAFAALRFLIGLADTWLCAFMVQPKQAARPFRVSLPA